VQAGAQAKLVSNWIQSELLALLHEHNTEIQGSPVGPKELAGLISLIENKTISGKIAKDVLPIMFETGKPAKEIVEEKGWVQLTDTTAIESIVDQVIQANPSSVSDFRAGKKKALGFLVGQIMQQTKGKANPQLTNEILTRKLSA